MGYEGGARFPQQDNLRVRDGEDELNSFSALVPFCGTKTLSADCLIQYQYSSTSTIEDCTSKRTLASFKCSTKTRMLLVLLYYWNLLFFANVAVALKARALNELILYGHWKQ